MSWANATKKTCDRRCTSSFNAGRDQSSSDCIRDDCRLLPARRKYDDYAEMYVHMEAGHAAQNLLLQAVPLGLGGVPIAAFDEDRIGKILDLPKKEVPLYLIPIGYPR